MDIYALEDALERGSHQYDAAEQAMALNTNVATPVKAHAFPVIRRATNEQDKYWKSGAPVMVKVEYNGESLMLPQVAPGDTSVSIKKPILDQTVNIIQDHNSTKANWSWKVNVLDERFRYHAPSNKTITINSLAALKIRTTPNVYTYTDVRLHGNMVNTDLPIEDTVGNNADAILATTRLNCRWISMTLTFSPSSSHPSSRFIHADELPIDSSMRVFMTAPQEPAGGLDVAITKAMITTSPLEILGMYPTIAFLALKSGLIPMRDVYDKWIQEQLFHAYFKGMVQAIRAVYIGAEIVTDSLNLRFNKLSQREYDKTQRKTIFSTVREFHAKILGLIDETNNMDEATIAQQVPELDRIFFQGLISRLQERTNLAIALQHPASANLGENLYRLTLIVAIAAREEKELNQIADVASNMASSYRRTTVGGTANAGSTFATGTQFDMGDGTCGIPPGLAHIKPAALSAGTLVNAPKESAADTFALAIGKTMLSSVERALRTSSGTNAPIQCWGCKDIYPEDTHIFRDCPHKTEERVQENFKINLDEYMTRRRNSSFDPNRYKKEGFKSKRATYLFNMILADDQSADQREQAIQSFLTETMIHSTDGPVTRSRQHNTSEGNEGNGNEGNALCFPTWVIPSSGQEPHELAPFAITCNASISDQIRFAISVDLPHLTLPIGKVGSSSIEGLLDSGGACNMGDLGYWKEVVARYPDLMANFYELQEHRIEPITIGGIGAGRVEITHVMELWLPWLINGQPTKFVMGLGENMPLTLLIGLPFFIAAKIVMDIDNQTCLSKTFNVTWKLKLKVPAKKTVRTLDNAESSANRLILSTSVVSPSPRKRIRFSDCELERSD